MTTALVTGGTGFVGGHLVHRLVRDGERPHLVIRPHADTSNLQDIADKIVLHEHQGTTESLIHIMRAARPRCVFHLASVFVASHVSTDVEPLVQSNLLFASQLLEAMSAEGCLSVVNTGTTWQHFEGGDHRSVNLYAATKQAFESILDYYVDAHAIQAITLKLADTYGPNDKRGKLLALLANMSASGESLEMSPGDQLIDLVHVDDVVRAFLVARTRLTRASAPQNESFAVTSGDTLSLRRLVATLEDAQKCELRILWGKRPYRNREVMSPWTEGSWLPGWSPTIPLSDGLKSLLESRHA